ncbi:peptidoglycan-binding protein [Streptomyces sp. NPDC088745]|uniref:peptidoglycan-binding protein n=1 Tax=Streptomyces sp. NPDC088745 TaxID=3365884 RepID=UPI003800E575
MADAEDFDPLRIRPYVNLAEPSGQRAPDPAGPPRPAAAQPRTPPAFEETRAQPPLAPPVSAQPPLVPPASAQPSPALQDTSAQPSLASPGSAGPSRTSPSFEEPRTQPPLTPAEQTMPLRPVPAAEPSAGSRRRGLVLVTAAATLAVLAGTAFAVGAFDSAPEETRAFPGITTAPTAVAEPTPSPAASRTAAPSPTATAVRRALPTPTRASRSATPPPKTTTAPPTAPPSKPPTTAPARRPTATPEPPGDQLPPGSLAPGSSGPEVRELQGRLDQIGLYDGPRDGRYTQSVTDSVARFQAHMNIDDEPSGVYGPKTREALEDWTFGR